MTITRRAVLVVASALLLARPAAADDIKVMTSGAFTAAYLELRPRFERGVTDKIVTTATSMGVGADSIPNRIAHGEAVDVVIMADDSLRQLIKDDLVLGDSRVELARSGIGIAVRAGTPKPDISNIAALRRTLLQAKSIAYSTSVSGHYFTTELVQRLGIADQVLPKSHQIDRERVGAVVARGEAEIGFQQISELLPEPGIEFVGALPADVQRVTVFSAGVAARSAHQDTARALIGFLASPDSLGAVTKTGMEPPASARNANDWTVPFAPFKIAGNLYYVGSKGVANYLITTPQGHILINSDLAANVPMIRASVEKLGFKFSDIKILLISHAHFDHDAGSAALIKATGAKYMVMDADVPVVESGGREDFQYGTENLYPPVKVDRVLHDGDEVKLGGASLAAHLTPGHTKGCTTWTMKVDEAGKGYNVVIVGGPNVNPGYKLVNNARYPQIASDYEKMFRVLKSLPCDIFLGAHGSYFDMEDKYAKSKGTAPGAFADPGGYAEFVAERERAFRADLAKQQTGGARE